MTDLYLHDWRGWTPHRDAQGESRLETLDKPAGNAIPAMLRRRLDLVGRALCDMLTVLDPAADLIIVHASRHGDGERTLEMLYALEEGEPLSPARFGLSVHNAIVGVYSIASHNRRSQQAIAASGAEWAALLSEARGYLADGESRLLVAFADQPVPERFVEYAPVTPEAAVVLQLAAQPAPGARRIIESSRNPDIHSGTHPGTHPDTPQPLDVIDWLTTPDSQLGCAISGRQWQLGAPQ